MKKFVSGLLVGGLLVTGISYGVNLTNAETTGNISTEESDAMQLAWYQYHHKTLSDALAEKCK